MKSLLLFANNDSGFESRLQAALDTARSFDSHLTCLQVTPFNAFVMAEPFGGVYAIQTVLDELRRTEGEHRRQIEQRLQREGVPWDWLQFDGGPAQYIVDRSRLADLIVLSLEPEPGEREARSLDMVGDVSVHARTPVLAVPSEVKGWDPTGPAVVAWNGSPESAHAIRLALPVLARSSAVHIVTVRDDQTEFPAAEACEYLARHQLRSQLHEWPRDKRSIADSLRDAASVLNASYILMGAYGHTRMREAVLGGVTRDMLRHSDVPLLLAH